MQPTAMAATEPTDNQDDGISSIINIFPPTASYSFQWPATAWTGILLPAPHEKPPSWGSQLAHILLQ